MTNQLRSPLRSSLRSPFEHRRGGSAAAPDMQSLYFSSGENGFIYQLSDHSTTFQDAAGTIPATASGDPLGLVLDKSGNGNHWSQPTAGKRMQLVESGGIWSAVGDGVDDYGITPSINWGSDKITAWTGINKADASTEGIIIDTAAAWWIIDGGFALYQTGGNIVSTSHGTGSISSANEATKAVPTGRYVVVETHDISGDLTTISANSVAGTDATVDQGAGNFSDYPVYIASRFGSSLFFTGGIYSMIVRGAATAAPDRVAGATWTATNSGVTLP